MNRMALAVLSSLLTLAACSPTAKTASNPSTQQEAGKVTAPVTVNAQLSEGKAHVTVRFASDATDVSIEVYGVDGLVVNTKATPMKGATVTAASEQAFDVAFTPGPGRSNLVVAVKGSFRGADRASVSSFAVGTPSAEQQKSSGTTVTGDDGQRVNIMPSGSNSQ